MEESQNFGHEHPLVLLNEECSIYNGSEEVECWRCGDKVSAPCFGCLESCGFYLHERCAKAPLVINHPFHPHHTLVLLKNSPYNNARYRCNFCDEVGTRFVYHCSCQLDLHIKCALFTINIAKNNLKELEDVALQDPFISTENDGEEIEDVAECFGCWEPLSSYAYYSPDCGFNMHKKCVELPFKMNHACHRKHSLVLQFNAERLACKICQQTSTRGFFYCCSLCKFVVHIECVLPPPIIEDKSHHPHTLTLFWARPSFFCDTCGTGTEGGHAAYICAICNIIVHRKCISIPHVIKHRWHIKHNVFHKHFIQADDLKSRDCIMCHKEVNIEHGSYYCANCDIIFHVNCATKDEDFYDIVSQENEDDILAPLHDVNSITIVETNDAGVATKVKHFNHMHNLILSDKIVGDHKCCDGCMLPILASFYYCSVCNFFLHKDCAEMPKVMEYWAHECKKPVYLIPNCIFTCDICRKLSNVFGYKCSECDLHICLRCVTMTPGAHRCLKHKHPLLFYYEYKGHCDGCGKNIDEAAFHCKDCNFTIDWRCFLLPIEARHKCDDHVLALTYHDDNDYPESYYCDICEETRDSNYWFYHCVTCDTSAHIKCVLGEYSFVKVGSTYEYEYHQHPLTFVKKAYYYPSCMECDTPCEDLSLECLAPGCNYIVHMDCIDYENLEVISPLEKSEDEGVNGHDT